MPRSAHPVVIPPILFKLFSPSRCLGIHFACQARNSPCTSLPHIFRRSPFVFGASFFFLSLHLLHTFTSRSFNQHTLFPNQQNTRSTFQQHPFHKQINQDAILRHSALPRRRCRSGSCSGESTNFRLLSVRRAGKSCRKAA